MTNFPENCGDLSLEGATGEKCCAGIIGWIFGGLITFFTLIGLVVNNLVILVFVGRQTLQARRKQQHDKEKKKGRRRQQKGRGLPERETALESSTEQNGENSCELSSKSIGV